MKRCFNVIDIIGSRSGKLSVVAHEGLKLNGKRKRQFYTCRCDCGKTVSVARGCLTSKTTKSCGCYRKDRKWSIHTGESHGRLTVLRERSIPYQKTTCLAFDCVCSCGNLVTVRAAYIGNRVLSCGCLAAENARTRIEKQHELNKLPAGQAAFNRLKRTYERRAAAFNRAFKLSTEQFAAKVKQECYYCGAPPGQVVYEKNGNCVYNGIDRVKNGEGYTAENTVACCAQCNSAKTNLAQDDFLAWARRVAARNPLTPEQAVKSA